MVLRRQSPMKAKTFARLVVRLDQAIQSVRIQIPLLIAGNRLATVDPTAGQTPVKGGHHVAMICTSRAVATTQFRLTNKWRDLMEMLTNMISQILLISLFPRLPCNINPLIRTLQDLVDSLKTQSILLCLWKVYLAINSPTLPPGMARELNPPTTLR